MDRLHVITPYKYHGGWVFDDARVELERELGIEGWLCPALLEYFENAPATLYVGGRGRETGVQP